MTIMALLFSLWLLKALMERARASPMAVPCTATDEVDMLLRNIFAET